jgi:hypothetical protein
MLVKTLLTCSLLVAPVIGQEQAPQPAPEKKPDPRIQRFLDRPDFFPRKTPSSAAEGVAEASRSRVCSVPLTNVTPKVTPFMPNLKPRVKTHDMAIAPPAPPCDDARQDTSTAPKKESKPAEQGSEARP